MTAKQTRIEASATVGTAQCHDCGQCKQLPTVTANGTGSCYFQHRQFAMQVENQPTSLYLQSLGTLSLSSETTRSEYRFIGLSGDFCLTVVA